MFVSTKLHAPPLNERMLYRAHLVDKLSSGKGCRLTVIHGVAGSGKTSLALQWIGKERIRAAWYSIDETDNESDVFFRYLLTALRDVDGKLASAVDPWLQKQKRFSGKELISSLIECLTELSEDIYLVLDDYHHITSQMINNPLSYFLEHMPPKMHVVIITRYCPPFSLSRFRVRDQIKEISAEDMKFTEEETKRYLAEVMSANFSPQEAHELTRYAGGWVAWLQLLDLSLKGKETLDDLDTILSRTLTETADYLIDEVINVQPKQVKDFLYATAVIERFNAALCREVTGLPNVQDILDYLHRNNLFLAPLDAEHTWYHYHHLFSDAIKQRVKRFSPDEVPRILRQAAIWFVQNNHLEDAFRHAFATEDFEFTADFLEDHLSLVYEGYEIASGLRWLAKLPHKVFMQRALLRLYQCGFRIDSFQLLDTESTISDIASHQAQLFKRYKGSKKKLCEDLLSYFQHVLPFFRDLETSDPGGIKAAVRAFSPENRFSYSLIKSMLYSFRHFDQGSLPSASNPNPLQEALTTISSSESVWAKITWFRSMAIIERWQGHLHRSEAILRDAFQFLDRKGLSDTHFKFALDLPMAWIFYFRNDLEKALEYANIALRYTEPVTDTIDIVEGSLLLAYIHQAMGEWGEVDRYIQKMQSTAKALGKPEVVATANAIRAHLAMNKGDLGWAERWGDRRKLTPDEPLCVRFVYECQAQAELFYYQNRYEEAVNMLEALRVRCVDRNIIEPVLEIDLILSAALKGLGEPERARAVMENLLVFSETEGYVHPIVSYAPVILPLLKDVTGRLLGNQLNNQASSHFTVIMKACGIDTNGAVVSYRSKGKAYDVLSPRELEILKLVAAGYRNKEIATKTFVSLNTVKTHLTHIFEKLDVKTRVEAVRWAEDLKPVERHKTNPY